MEIDEDIAIDVKIRLDAVVRCHLRKSAGAAWPAGLLVYPLAVELVIGVVKSLAVILQRLGTEYRVVHYAFHAVTVAGITRNAKQVAGQLEVGVAAAWSFEAGVGVAEACKDVAAARRAQLLVGSPASRGKTLLEQHGDGIFRRSQVHLATTDHVGHHGRAE